MPTDDKCQFCGWNREAAATLERVERERDDVFKLGIINQERAQALAAQVEALRKVLERCYHAADTRRDTAGLRFTAHPAFEDAANLLAALSAPAEERSLEASRDHAPTLRAALERIVRDADDISEFTTLSGDHVVRASALKQARAALASSTPERNGDQPESGDWLRYSRLGIPLPDSSTPESSVEAPEAYPVETLLDALADAERDAESVSRQHIPTSKARAFCSGKANGFRAAWELAVRFRAPIKA